MGPLHRTGLGSGKDSYTRMTEAQQKGEACAKCGVEFDGQHGRPVLCHTCHDSLLPGLKAGLPYPKAWLEEKVK